MQTQPIVAELPADLLKRVGTVLIIVGVADIAWMVYVLSRGQAYSSSLSVFAVIAGFLLRRHSLRTARIVRWFSAFFLAALLGANLALPIMFPFDLIRTYVRVTPTPDLLGSVAFMAAALTLFGWIYRALSRSSVEDALYSAGFRDGRVWQRPRAAFWFGAAFAGCFAVLFSLINHSDSAQEALKRARQERGPEYRYYVSSLSVSSSSDSGTDVRATVLAYTDSTIEPLEFAWHE